MQWQYLFAKCWVRVLYALILTALSLFLVHPYVFGLYDHWYMLAWINNLRNPEVLALDPIIAQREYHYSLLYGFIKILPFSLPVTFFSFYSICLWIIFYISMSIHRVFSEKLIFLTPLFLLLPWHTPGGTQTIPELLLMRMAGLPFLLISVWFWLKGKSWQAWLMVGIAFLFHPTTALYLAAFFGIAIVFDNQKRNSTREWISILPFIVLAIPVFYQKFSAPDTGFNGFIADDYWLETIRVRSAHHAFPDAWSPPILLSGLTLLLISLGLSFSHKNRLTQMLTAVFLGTVLIWACGLIFTYALPSYMGIQVQPFRVSRLMMILALTSVPIVLSRPNGIQNKTLLLIIILGLLFAGAYQQSKFHFFYYFSLSLILIFSWFWSAAYKYTPLLTLVTFFIVLDNRSWTVIKLNDNVPENQKEMYRWIDGHTSAKSLWFIPSDLMYFRNHAERAAAVAWFDGTFGYFDHQYNQNWRERYESVFGELKASATEPSLKGVNTVLRDFSTQEIYILKREKVDSLSAVYSDKQFFIYRLQK